MQSLIITYIVIYFPTLKWERLEVLDKPKN